MRIIGVIDVRGGVAVHARGGDRAHYAPVRSRLHDGSDPIGIARAYRDRLGLDAVYVADLDAIAGKAPDLGLVRDLAALGLTVWVDAGAREASDAAPVLDAGASVVVAGLETLRDLDALAEMIARFGTDRVAFSLDLHEGRPIVEAWGSNASEVAAKGVGAGVTRMIVLDLARVGSGEGTGTLGLVASLRAAHPNLGIVAGGGVSGTRDLRALAGAGASAALVASALHDGLIEPRNADRTPRSSRTG